MNRSPHFPYPSFLHTPPRLHLESTSPCLLSFTTHRNPITIQSSVSVKYFVGIRWQKKQALWLMWVSLCLLAAHRVQMRLSSGSIQLLMTLTHLFFRVFWCLSVILYTQNCNWPQKNNNYVSGIETNCQATIRTWSSTCCFWMGNFSIFPMFL